MADVFKMYMDYGEDWENDPKAYVAAFKDNRAVFKSTLEVLDCEKMVSTWSDETLYDVELSGSDLGFDKYTRKRVNEAAKLERSKRNPAVSVGSNGMAADGGQKVEDGE